MMTDRDEYSTCRVCGTPIRRHLIGGVMWGAWLHDRTSLENPHPAEPVEEP